LTAATGTVATMVDAVALAGFAPGTVTVAMFWMGLGPP
jgi:hypothetical protein